MAREPVPWPEYAIEAALLGLFMLSACVCTVLVEHPDAQIRRLLDAPFARRALIGAAMGLTAIVLIRSSWGRRSGAHFNPAVTIAFLRLGKIRARDALGYVAAQIVGGLAGVQLAALLLGARVAHPTVAFAVTVPGTAGVPGAFVAECAISFAQMGVVLLLSNGRFARHTGLVAGALVATWITFEAPLSGMSMNPARTLASAFAAGEWHGFWIYLVAPLAGMLAAAEVYVRRRGIQRVYCAKLQHEESTLSCVFRCTYSALAGVSCRAIARTLAVVVVLAATALPRPARAAELAARALATGPVAIVVSDLDRASAFYADVLGFAKTGEAEVAGDAWERLEGVFGVRMRIATLRLGDESIALVQYLAPRGRPVPQDARANDHDFQHIAIVVRDMPRAYARLREHGVEHASSGPQRLPASIPAAAGIEAFYFRDPDGHYLEILAFPPDKGDPRWHRPGDDLFLGIDHTAIVVADTDAALRLYRDVLGLRVAGESENRGVEQEHLNNVRGAHLRITTLRPPSGPGIELLEYLAPRDGRPAPRDERANDLANWQTRVTVADPQRAVAALHATHARIVSDGVVALSDDPLGATRAAVVRDRDGHDLEIADAPQSARRAGEPR